MADIRGVCEGRFEAARSALARNLDSGEELGASLWWTLTVRLSSTCGVAFAIRPG